MQTLVVFGSDRERAIQDRSPRSVHSHLSRRVWGGITVADVTLASASHAVIVGFNVIPDEQARSLADDRNVEIRRYDIIYKLAEDIKAILEGRLKPELPRRRTWSSDRPLKLCSPSARSAPSPVAWWLKVRSNAAAAFVSTETIEPLAITH